MKPGLLLFGILGTATALLGQWVPPDLQPRNLSIESTGGVAYLKFSYESACPQELGKTTPTRNGTNVNQQVFIWNSPRQCPAIFPPPIENHHATLVLGAFEPGDYLCHLSVSSDGMNWLTRTIPFAVAPDRTMTLLPFGGPGIAFRVAGTSNVTYRILTSPTLTEWTALSTNENAPFTITNQGADKAFFQIEIRDRVQIFP
jgi:hypothetical protein